MMLNKLGFSVYAAAALVNLLRRQRDASGLTLFDNAIRYHSKASNTLKHQMMLYAQLGELLKPDSSSRTAKTTDLATTLHEVAERLHKRSLVVIFSDMIEGNQADQDLVFDALQHLRYNKHEVILFHVTDKKLEGQFDFENRPYRFIDMETGEQIKVNPAEVREAYLAQNATRLAALKLRCTQYHIDFVEADINHGFNDVLFAYMIKRGKLY